MFNWTVNLLLRWSFVAFWKSSQPQQPQDDQQWLLTCIPQYLGFSGSKPVATLLIYQCLLHWRSFEAMKTGVFDRILHAINSAIEVPHTSLDLNSIFLNLNAASMTWSTTSACCNKLGENIIYWMPYCSRIGINLIYPVFCCATSNMYMK